MSIDTATVRSQDQLEPEAALAALIDHIARLLATEYVELMEAAAAGTPEPSGVAT